MRKFVDFKICIIFEIFYQFLKREKKFLINNLNLFSNFKFQN